jgi:hypothetical protein
MLQQWLGDAILATTWADNRPKRDELGMPYCPPLIFLDTSALKLAADRQVRGIQRRSTVRWGPHDVDMDWVQFVEVNPNANVYAGQRQHISALPMIAHLADRNRVRLTTHMEVLWELDRLPKHRDVRGRFYGVAIEDAPDPFEYSRVIASGLPPKRDWQMDFLVGLRESRFEQLKVAVGANPGSARYRNQLLDAFHIRCAEGAGAHYFLTLDEKLVRHVAGHRRAPPLCRVITPTSLRAELVSCGALRLRDRLAFHRFRREMRRRSTDPYSQLVDLGARMMRRR